MQPPLNIEECRCWVEQAKTLPAYEQALIIESCLYQRAIPDNDPEIMREIGSIRSHFFVERQQKALDGAKKQLEQYIKSRFGLPELAVDDDQIARAIIESQVNMTGYRDWFSYYRVLVDFCGYPSTMTHFSNRIQRLDFPGSLKFPCDYSKKNVNGSFYQGLKNGGAPSWPPNYKKWLTYTPDFSDEVFNHRKDVAKSFYDKLKEM